MATKEAISPRCEVRKRAGEAKYNRLSDGVPEKPCRQCESLLFAARTLHAPLLIISYDTHPEQILQLCFRAVVNRVPVVV